MSSKAMSARKSHPALPEECPHLMSFVLNLDVMQKQAFIRVTIRTASGLTTLVQSLNLWVSGQAPCISSMAFRALHHDPCMYLACYLLSNPTFSPYCVHLPCASPPQSPQPAACPLCAPSHAPADPPVWPLTGNIILNCLKRTNVCPLCAPSHAPVDPPVWSPTPTGSIIINCLKRTNACPLIAPSHASADPPVWSPTPTDSVVILLLR